MKKKLLHDISANTLQVMINQLCGLVIFYILSAQLTKNDFGEVNWSLAVLLTSFAILSFGIDQVAIKKIAAGDDIHATVSAYMAHVLLSGILVYTLLLLCNFLFPSFYQQHQLLLFIGFGKLMLFFATPFKQLATGLEKFKPLLYMSVGSNILRSIALLLFVLFGLLDLRTIIIIFIAGDLAELLICLLITKFHLKIPLGIQWNKKNYTSLVKESLPQLGVAIFTSAIARFDWIFLGLLASNIVLANYSFAYKVFEMATIPLLVIAPILIPRFTKLFKDDNYAGSKIDQLFTLLRVEIVIASLVALVLNILWVPVIDLVTQNKYGAINSTTILVLSASMPFLYFNNFLWTISFVKGHLKKIFYIFFICFIVNLSATAALIPFWGAEGAAIAYFFSIIVQSVLFYLRSGIFKELQKILLLLVAPASAFGAGALSNSLFINPWLALFTALIIYTSALLLTRQLKRSDWHLFKQVSGL
jgi:O-antigen/teichoic acid export membrane protein